MGANTEITVSSYIRWIAITIPGNAGAGSKIFDLIESDLTDAEKARVVALILHQHAAAFDVNDQADMAGEGESIGIGVNYTEPCLDEWLKRTFVRSQTAATIAAQAKVYIGVAPTVTPRT